MASTKNSRASLPVALELLVSEHTRLEEEIFYPWLRENLGADASDLVDEALVEHATAKDLVAQVQGAGTVDETFDARVTVLGEYVRHHVREEEDEIFPRVAGRTDALDELGQEMHARKAELIDELGLPQPDEDEGGAMARMPMRGSRAGSRGHAQRSTR